MTAIKPCKGSGQGEHKFTKFDDVSVVCERCAERRVVAEAVAPSPFVIGPYVYPYVPHIPPTWPNVYPNWWAPQPRYEVWCDTGSSTYTPDLTTQVFSTDVSVFGDANRRYAPAVMTNAIAGAQTQTPRGVRPT